MKIRVPMGRQSVPYFGPRFRRSLNEMKFEVFVVSSSSRVFENVALFIVYLFVKSFCDFFLFVFPPYVERILKF